MVLNKKDLYIEDFRKYEIAQESNEVNNLVFSLINHLGYEKYLDEMESFNSAYKLMKKIGKNNFSVFFSWYILKSDADIDLKKYFLKYVLDEEKEDEDGRLALTPSDEHKEIIAVFTESQIKEFSGFILDNNLINDRYSSLRYYYNHMDEKQLLQKNNIKTFCYSNINIYKDYKKLIDFIFENAEEIYKEIEDKNDEYIKKHGNSMSYEKKHFQEFMISMIIAGNDYFVEKLMSTKGGKFKFITQDFLNEAISKLYNSGMEFIKTNDDEKEAQVIFKPKNHREFTEKLVSDIALNNIRATQVERNEGYGDYLEDDEENNYFNLILEYTPEEFDKLNIDDITSKNIELPSFLFNDEKIKEIIKKKILEKKEIDYGDFIKNNGKILETTFRNEIESIFLDEDIIKHIERNFSENGIISYIIFLHKRTDIYNALTYESNILNRLVSSKKFSSKIPIFGKYSSYKKSLNVKRKDFVRYRYDKISSLLNSDIVENFFNKESKIVSILSDYKIINFISIFSDDFASFNSILKSGAINLLKDLDYKKIDKISTFILMTKRIENINIDIKLKDIDEDFVNFVLKKFPKELEGNFAHGDTKKINNFFDIQIDNLDFFEQKNSIKNVILDDKYKVRHNFKKLCELFSLDYKLSTIIDIENNFNKFLGNKDGNKVFLKTILGRDDEFNFIISFFEKVYKKDIDINTMLLITKNLGKNGVKIWLSHMLLMDEKISDFNIKDIISINGDVDSILLNKVNNLNLNAVGDFYNEDIILKYFDNWTIEKLDSFLRVVVSSHIFSGRGGRRENETMKTIIGYPCQYFDKAAIENDPVLMYRINKFLIQISIDSGDFSKLSDQIGITLDTFRHFYVKNRNIDGIFKKLENILKQTNGFLSKNLIKHFIVGEEYLDKLHIYDFDDSIQKVEDLTGIKIKNKDFEDSVDDVINLLLKINSTWLQNIFEKFPINEKKGRFWKLKDIKEGGILHKIIENPYFAYNILEKKGFSLKQIDKFLSYNLMSLSPGIEDKILEYDDIYYAYFKFFINSDAYSYDSDKLKKFPINLENFIDYMDDDESIINFNKDEGVESEGDIKPGTKAWFLEKPERKEYLKSDNLHSFKRFGLVTCLYMFEGLTKGIDNSEMRNISKDLGFDVGMEFYSYIKSIDEQGSYFWDIVKKLSGSIKGIERRKVELLFGYLTEYGISIKYFLEDMIILQEGVNIDILIKLLKNRIYPTNNIINFLKDGAKIKDLLVLRENYKQQGIFDVNNKLYVDLEYIDFRYIIDTSSNRNIQVGKGYEEYKQLISRKYDEKLDSKDEYMQAGYESYIAHKFIKEKQSKSNFINVFSNLSYGKVVTGAIKEELISDKNINFKETRIGSTESHGNLFYVKKDLFAKEDIKKLFMGDSIIFDGTTNKSFPDSNIGYKNYFYILNKILFDFLKDENFIKNYDQNFSENFEKQLEYKEIYNYLKGIIFRNGLLKYAKPFNFVYVSQNSDMSFKTRNHNREILNDKDFIEENGINIYFADFVDREPEFGRQAYFDDRHIIDFKIIPTKKGFSFVDVQFEKELKKYFQEFKKRNIDIKFNYFYDF